MSLFAQTKPSAPEPTREDVFEDLFPGRESQRPFWNYWEAVPTEDVVLTDRLQGVSGTWVDLPEKALYVITAVAEFDGGYGLARAYRRGEPNLAAHEASGKGIVARTWIAELDHGTRLDVMAQRKLGYEPVTLRAAGSRLQVVGPLVPSRDTGL